MGDDLREIGIAVIGGIIGTEALEWSDFVSRWLTGKAVSRLPEPLRDRYLEEWSADLADFPGRITKVLRALGYVVASYKLAAPAWTDVKKWLFNRLHYAVSGVMGGLGALAVGDWVGFLRATCEGTITVIVVGYLIDRSPHAQRILQTCAAAVVWIVTLPLRSPPILNAVMSAWYWAAGVFKKP